ncbi:PAS domain-containing sensor histidine kinase [Duganella sp. BJB488]|uniref:ATP-binding protein n=1 Tax=unclassified Duganella TaxID=2636909 RepID=UPI000E344F42|nr:MULTISPECIES: PAS domain-containing hybrid sensor histidine kinase/response regulator [unclassified Duganella]RFP21526.1 PAS domain-containing sensor histidine kinase [Duganella sp. BJB489]RFP23319.1 PAS domain-containing sensor histidine kinase [Duganella sp. BJB488]RFP38485.1 PAS domain-containing sensor histidine kinase [Duganella sp. BJB480]
MLDRLARRAGRVSIAVFVSVTLTAVVTLVLTTFALYFYQVERAQRWEQLHKTLANSADELSAAVALPAWNFDETQIVTIMKSGLSNRDLYASAVAPVASNHPFIITRNDQAQLVSATRMPDNPELLFEERPIVAGGQNIGTITVFASPAGLIEQLRQRLYTIAGMIFVLDVTLVLSLYLLLWQLILKPLTTIERYAANVKAGQNPGALPPTDWFFGELKTLNGSIREMVRLMDSRFVAMHASEERLQIASSAAAIGIWDWNILTDEVVWDEQMYRLHGIEGRKVARPFELWRSMMHPDDAIPTEALLRQALEGTAEFDVEFRVVWADGSVHYIKGDAMIFRDAEGHPARMVGVNYDVTASRVAEQELRRHRIHLEDLVAERTNALSVAVLQAQAANQAKSIFLANMSHELRTPLNSVIGFSRLMADSKNMLPEEKRNLAIIHRSGQHLLTLINDILELSKIEAGRASLQTEVVGLHDMLQEVMDMVSMRAGQTGVELELDAAGLPAGARVDGTKLRQVLLNLMSNAVKFTGQGKVTLRVRGAMRNAPHGCELEFAVIDTGPGISPADQARIFEPFIQADGPGAHEGTGLGLTISREFVQLMGGDLTVQSAPGAGATFRFAITVQVADSAPVIGEDDEVAALAPPQRGRRILVADDNADGCALLENLLQPLGFEVAVVGDGAQALAMVDVWRPDLVFMDWRMPALDGLSATRQIRANAAGPQPRVVMLTASAYAEEREEALAAGADEFMRKPVEQEQLYAVLEQQLGLQFMRRHHSARQPLPPPLSRADLGLLEPALRQQLKTALQELNLPRVALLLAPLPLELAEVVERIEHMIRLHQYPQLCGLLDEADNELEAQA